MCFGESFVYLVFAFLVTLFPNSVVTPSFGDGEPFFDKTKSIEHVLANTVATYIPFRQTIVELEIGVIVCIDDVSTTTISECPDSIGPACLVKSESLKKVIKPSGFSFNVDKQGYFVFTGPCFPAYFPCIFRVFPCFSTFSPRLFFRVFYPHFFLECRQYISINAICFWPNPQTIGGGT